MTPATTSVALEPATPELTNYASPPCPPHLKPADDRSTPGETQPAATARPRDGTGSTHVPRQTSSGATALGLPRAARILAVIARPGQESAGLGALLYTFRRRGATLALLSLTRGEASQLNSTCERLETIRPAELQMAAGHLGVSSVAVSDFPDGGLRLTLVPALTERVRRAIRRHAPDLLLVVGPAAAGDIDGARAAQAACLAANLASLPVLALTLPDARNGWEVELGADTAAARATQRCAAQMHASQSAAHPQVLHRVDQLGGRERVRWLVPPAPYSRAAEELAAVASLSA